MRNYKDRDFKNLEFLRFLLIWAVVGVHVAYLNLNNTEGFLWMTAWTSGWQAVEMFFVMSGFFLFYNVKPQESILNFAVRKWLRLAPCIIVLTIIGYSFTGFNISQYPLSVNIFNSLLLLDWNTHHFGPDATIIYVAWFVNALLFVSVVYFSILKTFKAELATFLIGAISFICFFMYNRHIYIIVPFIFPLVRAFAYMGFGYLICQLWKSRSQDLKADTSNSNILISLLEAVLLACVTISLFAGSTGISTPEGLTVPPEQIATLNAETWFPDLTRWALGGVWLQICFIALFWLFLCRKGLVSQLLNNRISVALGRYSYTVFLVHTIVVRAIRDYLKPDECAWVLDNPAASITLLCLIILCASIAVHHLIEMPLLKIARR